MKETGELLILGRNDIINCEMYSPINEIRPSHLRHEPYQKFKSAGIVLLKAEGKSVIMKSRYDLVDVCESFIKRKDKSWRRYF